MCRYINKINRDEIHVSVMSERQRAFVLTQIEHLTEDDIAKIVYVKGCTELEGQSAIRIFQALEKKQRFTNYLENIASIFEEIGRKDLARNVSTFNLKQSGATSVIKRGKIISQNSEYINTPCTNYINRYNLSPSIYNFYFISLHVLGSFILLQSPK